MDNKKVYTMEDNVKYISFGIKDLVAEMKKIAEALQKIAEKNSNSDSLPF